jgi:hypothetical protein
MKQHSVLFSSVAIVAILVIVISSLALAQSPTDSQPDQTSSQSSQELGQQNNDSNPSGTPDVIIPAQYQPSQADLARALTVPVSTVYFTPQDENTNTTVLFLYNTNPVTATVSLDTYYLNGSLTLSTTIAVPPNSLVRICGDAVSTISSSWQNVVLVNFTTFSTYAKMTLPAKVKAEGFVVWDTTGIYDPLVSLQTLPLRFSTDTATLMLPIISR